MTRATHCEECSKKLPKPRKGPGKPRRFCKGPLCAQRNWQKKHRKVRVAY